MKTIGGRVRQLVARAWWANRPLAFSGAAMMLLAIVTLIALPFDTRMVTGAPVWMKPLKFAISTAFFSFTILWMLTYVRNHPRLVRSASWLMAGTLGIEIVIITAQAVRGLQSHFNFATLLDGTLFGIMAAAIGLFWLVNFGVAILLCVQAMPDRTLAWGIRLGLLLSVVGGATAMLMTGPKGTQISDFVGVIGAHSVGVADGGAGLPLVGWSTVGGDLRIPHFVGLHGLQMLPFVAWLIGRWRAAWLDSAHRVALVAIAGAAYLGLIGLLLWQALRAQSIVAPDGLTLGSLGGLAALTGVAVALIIGHARSARDVSVLIAA